MLNWYLANEITPEFGAVLLILNLVSFTVLLATLYIRDIEACIRSALKRLYPFTLCARFRLWRSTRNARN
jgi:hypothetical protein